MTEATWLSSGDLGQLLTYIRKQSHLKSNRRRLGLFSVSCVVQLCDASPGLRTRAIEIAGRLADGEVVPFAELVALSVDANNHAPGTHLGSTLIDAMQVFNFPHRWPVENRVKWIAGSVATNLRKHARVFQCHLFRDIFGNPFRLVTFSPSWQTDTAIALARQMYASHDFGAMPILADALQDVGCDSEDILSHCRDTSLTHVRGCWVTDLVLDKE